MAVVEGKTGYNYKNLGRFMMDNVYPVVISDMARIL